jgi:hypothetical protein
MYYYELMNKETLTVEENNLGTVTYRNADGDFHNSHGPAVVGLDGWRCQHIKLQIMNKETLTVETDEEGTTTYRNADGERHNPHGPAVVGLDGWQSALD